MSESTEPVTTTTEDSDTTTSVRGGLSPVLTDGAAPVAGAITNEDDLLASIEARLAEEVRGLANTLAEFSRRTQRIGEELPVTAHFGKSITRLLSLSSLHVSYALLKDGDQPLLIDDGAEHLKQLGLGLSDFIREVDLDGQRFLAIALVNDEATEFNNAGKAG